MPGILRPRDKNSHRSRGGVFLEFCSCARASACFSCARASSCFVFSPTRLSYRNRTKNWQPAIKKSFVFKRQLLCGRCVEFQYFGESDLWVAAARSTQHAARSTLCVAAAMLQCVESAYCSLLQSIPVCCRCCCCNVLQHFAALQLLLCLNARSLTNSTTQASNSR